MPDASPPPNVVERLANPHWYTSPFVAVAATRSAAAATSRYVRDPDGGVGVVVTDIPMSDGLVPLPNTPRNRSPHVRIWPAVVRPVIARSRSCTFLKEVAGCSWANVTALEPRLFSGVTYNAPVEV